MRAHRVGGVLAFAAFLSALVVAIAWPRGGDALNGPGLIRVFAVTTEERSSGNYVGSQLFVSTQLETDNHKPIGSASQICTLGLDGVSSCLVTYVLPRGKIMAQGTRHQRAYYLFAVVGGTGIYTNVSGSVLAETLSLGPRRERLLFSLGI